MAFSEIKNQISRPAGSGLKDVVRGYVRSNGQLLLVVSEDVSEALGEPDYLKILTGSEEHNGFIALLPKSRKSSGVYKFSRARMGGGSRQLTVMAKLIGLPERPVRSVTLPHVFSNGGIIVDTRPILKAEPAKIEIVRGMFDDAARAFAAA